MITKKLTEHQTMFGVIQEHVVYGLTSSKNWGKLVVRLSSEDLSC